MRYLVLVWLHYGVKGLVSFVYPMYFTQRFYGPDKITFRKTGHHYYKGVWWKNPCRGCGVDHIGTAVKLI